MIVWFLLLAVLEIILVLQFAKRARLLADYSSGNNAPVFGRHYRNAYELCLDLNFLNDLFAGTHLSDMEDDQLRVMLSAMRYILFAQIVLGFLFLLAGIATGLSK